MTDQAELAITVRAELEEIAGLMTRLEGDLASAQEARKQAEVIRRHVIRNPERFSPHERENVFNRALKEAERTVRLETMLDASRERLDLLRALEPALAPPAAAGPAPPSLVEIHEAVTSERARIARELNDGPAQVLSNLLLEAEILERLLRRDPALVLAELEEFKSTVRDAVADMRRVMFDLRPLSLDDRGLVPALRMLASEYQERTGTACQVSIEGEERRLPAAVEEALYRILQEALSNVTRHAQARRVEITLVLGEAGSRLQVDDDGRGFDPAGAEGGDGRRRLGLHGMRERAAAAGGRLEIRSRPGGGTSLVVEVAH